MITLYGDVNAEQAINQTGMKRNCHMDFTYEFEMSYWLIF